MIDYLMETFVDPAIYSLGLVMALLIFYIVLFRVYYKYHPGPYPLWSYLAVALFGIMDVALNFTVMSVWMIDPPREWTITERLRRYKASSKNREKGLHWWRYQTAYNLCLILNIFDKKGHC